MAYKYKMTAQLQQIVDKAKAGGGYVFWGELTKIKRNPRPYLYRLECLGYRVSFPGIFVGNPRWVRIVKKNWIELIFEGLGKLFSLSK